MPPKGKGKGKEPVQGEASSSPRPIDEDLLANAVKAALQQIAKSAQAGNIVVDPNVQNLTTMNEFLKAQIPLS